ncbi:PE domain-containing protein [Mycolicibacterium fortuitum]|uniref:PE domain-containing protein n=1 Tax=Mycolicibacterium fortuitum TaxID=1766 RepID=UPI001CE02D6A|nr:PE domain-containing protein [Mycolicibacterium fortuitum]MCA4727333.1 PE domain-containing protein [Mycolicibacterium fortuitum]
MGVRVSEPQLVAQGMQMIENAMQGVTQATATLAPATVIAPAGVDDVSMLASSAFSAQTAMLQASNLAAQLNIALHGGGIIESAAAYGAADSAGAAIVG